MVNIIRNSKKEYYAILLIENKQNIQGTWKVLNSVIHKRKYKGEYPNNFIKDNRIINNINEIVNEFNDYFVKIFYNLANKISI